MTPIVADTGPLIALGRVDHLDLLRRLYRQIVIPPAVLGELAIGSGRAGAAALGSALAAGWLSVQPLANQRVVLELGQLLDIGEAEAIALTEQLDARFLLIDEAAGRQIARRRGVSVTGVASVLLSAKASGAVVAVRPIIEELSNAGYRLSSRLVSSVLERAGE